MIDCTLCVSQDIVKECTFQPVTTWRSVSRASSAARDLPETGVHKAAATPEDALSRRADIVVHLEELCTSSCAVSMHTANSDRAARTL